MRKDIEDLKYFSDSYWFVLNPKTYLGTFHRYDRDFL